MRESNIIWSRIFSRTIGARSWLSKAPYIFEKRFNSSYKQMCKFLMTFGDKLTDIKFEKLDLGLRGSVEKVGPRAFICAGNDSKLSRYDFSTGEVTLLTSTQETDGLLRDKYLITFDVQFNTRGKKSGRFASVVLTNTSCTRYFPFDLQRLALRKK